MLGHFKCFLLIILFVKEDAIGEFKGLCMVSWLMLGSHSLYTLCALLIFYY